MQPGTKEAFSRGLIDKALEFSGWNSPDAHQGRFEDNPKAIEARLLRDTSSYFGCKPGFPAFLEGIIDAVKDPEGPRG
jgi:hypothetical protein